MQELANNAELSWRTLSDLERGKRQDPQLTTLLAIASGLGVELSRLVEVLDDYTDQEESKVMTGKGKINDPRKELRKKIDRKEALIRKWKQAAKACDATDRVGQAVKRYCQGLARWQEEERDRLESDMRKLSET